MKGIPYFNKVMRKLKGGGKTHTHSNAMYFICVLKSMFFQSIKVENKLKDKKRNTNFNTLHGKIDHIGVCIFLSFSLSLVLIWLRIRN